MSPADRLRYEAKKRELASRQWAYVQNYADAETDIFKEIIAKTSENAR